MRACTTPPTYLRSGSVKIPLELLVKDTGLREDNGVQVVF
jgi:hypothetical protein